MHTALLIDNYDSFVHNLARLIRECGFQTDVRRNDALSLDAIAAMQPSHIVLSPGPCTPDDAGITLDVIRRFSGCIPLLGVCLGHQAIAQAFGARIKRATPPMHGRASLIMHDGQGIFRNIPTPFKAARYHSLAVSRDDLPDCLTISATSMDGEIMGLQHRELPVTGVQFHPESILTSHGHALLQNFLEVRPQSSV
ncbi:anthranilate synthase component II [Legionella geestiana]|uniref:anthranilate synthase component II n=1 Tax=Legionella geestiana TaxID=45065 RepID=UPI00056353BF|nr:aminodeoxychorismate/anthranilate synthase component II [Legionella geestiana]